MMWHNDFNYDFNIVFQKDFGGFYFIDLYWFAGQSFCDFRKV